MGALISMLIIFSASLYQYYIQIINEFNSLCF